MWSVSIRTMARFIVDLDDGYLHVTGRKDNMFISGGENIQPEEIEAALNRLDGVAQSIIVPGQDAEFDRRPVAFAQIDEESTFDPQALLTQLEATLPRFKLPVRIHPWPENMKEGLKPSRTEFQKLV